MTQLTLTDLGWSDHFAHQLDADITDTPARITAVHRAEIDTLGPNGTATLITPDETGKYAVGDWVLHDGTKATALLDRQTLIYRRAAGETSVRQLIAANVETMGIVSSCNHDFNPARLERYLAMAGSSGCLPLIILTKADMCDDPDDYRRQAEALSPLVTALTLDARDTDEVARLTPWCKDGQTLALVGSSGVGKTTIQNVLTGVQELTQDIREDDAKGRHTTTARALRRTLAGGWLVDTPGMRELRLTDAADGIEAVFSDLTELVTQCKFNDCSHVSEPGCAIQAAIAAGHFGQERVDRWNKLLREDARNNETIAQSHKRTRRLEKTYRSGKARGDKKRGY